MDIGLVATEVGAAASVVAVGVGIWQGWLVVAQQRRERSARLDANVSYPGMPIASAHPPTWAVHRRRSLGSAALAFVLLIVTGVLGWSWLSDLSHAVGAPELVAQQVVRVHAYPVRSEYVCSDGVASGIVVEVILDYWDSEVPIVTWSGVTDKGRTIYPSTPLLLKVSNGQPCR